MGKCRECGYTADWIKSAFCSKCWAKKMKMIFINMEKEGAQCAARKSLEITSIARIAKGNMVANSKLLFYCKVNLNID